MKDEKSLLKREKLVKESDIHKEALKEQVEDIKSSAEQWLKTILVVGGTIIISYTFVKSLFNKDPKSNNENLPARAGLERDGIAQRVLEQIAFFLMAVAREKLMDFLKKYGKNEPKNN